MKVLRIDLGSGQRPRGDFGITLPALGGTVDVTSGIDEDLEKWGWPVLPGTEHITADLEDVQTWDRIHTILRQKKVEPACLLSHVLEHLRHPYLLLERVAALQPVHTTVVVPNASVSRADWVDTQHRFSWTGGSLVNLVNDFGVVRKMGWFGPLLDLAVQYVPQGSEGISSPSPVPDT